VRFGRILALSVAIIATSASSAAADLGPPPPNLESASPCISVSARPHAVSVGASITGRTGPGTGGCTEKQLSWNWFAAGERVTACATNSTVCVIKTDRPTSAWTTLCVVGTGSSGGLTACDYVAVLGGGLHDLSGTIESGAPGSLQASGVTVRARGPGGTHTTVTDSHGNYTFAVAAGTYLVTPGRPTFPAHRTVSVTRDTTGVDFALAVDHIALRFSPRSVDANGLDRYIGAATVTDTSGAPRARQPVTFTPPLNVTPRALVCGRAGLLYPTLLSDGTPLGSHFLARTDASGVIPLSVWVGTQPGNWLLQGAESDNAAVSDSLALSFAGAGAPPFSPGLIAGQFRLAVAKTTGGGSGINLFSSVGAVGQSQASNQAVLLAFLRTVTAAFPSADYGPVHAGGAAGIVFYRHGTADPLSSGVVMSVDQASDIIDAVGSGHPIPAADEALTPLATWAAGHGVPSPADALGSLAPPPRE
jgi:hypothetical protein